MIDTSKFNYENFVPSVQISDTIEKGTDVSIGLLCRNDDIFTNRKALFVEYYDIMEVPYFYVLNEMVRLNALDPSKNPFSKYCDMSSLEALTSIELFKWYVRRSYRNIFDNISIRKIKEVDMILDTMVKEERYYDRKLLPFNKVIAQFRESNIIDKIYLWTPTRNTIVETKVNDRFIKLKDNRVSNVSYVYGDFKKVMEKVHPDCTYIFSDIHHIDELAELKRLAYSSVVLPIEYKYNYDEDHNFIIDIDKYIGSLVFKLNLFSVFTHDET